MDNISIRLAVKSDLPGVTEMSKSIFGGLDDFSVEFTNYLDNPNRRILIAEKDGNVVGLYGIFIVDGGETAIGTSLRVHVEHRRQGIGRALFHAWLEYVKKNFPKVKVARYSVGPQSLAEAVERLGNHVNSELILKVSLFTCSVNSTEFASRHSETLSAAQCGNLKSLNKIAFERFLKDDKIGCIPFKDNFMLRAVPFKKQVSNVAITDFVEEGDTFYATFSGNSGDTVESLSHSRWIKGGKHLMLSSVFYTLDEEYLKIHLIKQLQDTIMKHPGVPFVLTCVIDTSLAEFSSELLFQTLALKDFTEPSERPYLSVYEINLV